jgi:NADH:ubiquinone oxidoreductase subunit 5 (subunit L)/multisubunit Na+/H+ antiporter MnhA subunit
VALLVLGVASGVLGVAFALAQHDLKRLLAYHSVENIGIIAMGIGLGLLGRARGAPTLVVLGFGGAVLHVANHAIFKSLLFLGAGSVHRATGERDLERLGGLGRRMPRTAALFLVGAAAISGLPPLNGFASEWLVAIGALGALGLPRGDPAAFAALAAPALAFVGALAAACFVKVQGAAFLGQARSPAAEGAHESPMTMLVPMGVLALACLAIGLASPLLLPALARGAATWARADAALLAPLADGAARSAWGISAGAAALLALTGALALLRRRLASAPAPRAETWGCAYAAPTPRMAYSASSFARILVQGFGPALPAHVTLRPPQGIFPRSARFASEVPEAVLDLAIAPVVRAYAAATSRLRGLANGRIHVQALLVLAALVALLAWRLLWW